MDRAGVLDPRTGRALPGECPAPRGVPQIEVSFDIDASGIVTVTAKDKATGKTQAIKITGSTGLTKDEIEKMKMEAEKNAEKDKNEKEKIEIKNKADNLVYTSEKSLKDVGDKAPKELKETHFVTENGKKCKALTLKIYSSGRIEPHPLIGFHRTDPKEEECSSFWIDLQIPIQIKCSHIRPVVQK